MKALDLDSGRNGNITYSINDTSVFKIDVITGTVLTNSVLNQVSVI